MRSLLIINGIQELDAFSTRCKLPTGLLAGPVLALLYPATADAPDEGGEAVEIKSPEGYRTEAELRAEAETLQHIMAHLPKNPFAPTTTRLWRTCIFSARRVQMRRDRRHDGSTRFTRPWCEW